MTNVKLLLNQGKEYLQRNMPSEALDAFEGAYEEAPEDTETLRWYFAVKDYLWVREELGLGENPTGEEIRDMVFDGIQDAIGMLDDGTDDHIKVYSIRKTNFPGRNCGSRDFVVGRKCLVCGEDFYDKDAKKNADEHASQTGHNIFQDIGFEIRPPKR